MLCFKPPHAFLELGGKRVHLDAPGEISFVSHAHSDHSSFLRKSREIIATRATLDLLEARGTRATLAKENGFSLLNSGHVLGGAQLHAEHDGFSFTYSSDFKLGNSLTLKGAETTQSDVLLMETTFGLPQYSFPKREEIYGEIGRWARREHESGKIVLLGGYALGKAQELVKCLNEYAGISPLVTDAIAKVNAVYAKHGVRMDYVNAASDEGKEELGSNFVAVLPMHSVSLELANALVDAYKKPVSTALATGWGSFYATKAHKVFALSDHEDFDGLLDYVERTGAKKVFTNHGFAAEFAETLRKRGLDAQPLENLSRKTLLEYG